MPKRMHVTMFKLFILTINTVNYSTEIVVRRVRPHLFREPKSTNLVVYEHKSAEGAQKLLGHNYVFTTKSHYIIKSDKDDESDKAFI